MIKTAMASSADLQSLTQWISTPSNFRGLREILGNILASVNSVADVLRLGAVAPNSPMTKQKAEAILPDINNLEPLKNTLGQIANIVNNTKLEFGPLSEKEKNAEILDSMRLKPFLMRMIHTIQLANVTPEQVTRIQQLTQGNLAEEVVSEVDPARMQAFLKQAIYSTGNDNRKTLKVVREILQNACDAAMKKSQQDPSIVPEIEIQTWNHPDDEYMDISASDNGVGMNWEVLSKKFFVYFASGKEGEKESAGGYGIAKAIIQETPRHGWSIESNGLHASKFDRSMYFATKGQHKPAPPQMQIKTSGTSISLFGLPSISSSEISSICANYAISNVKISINGLAVTPSIQLKDVTPLDNEFSSLAKTVSKNEIEQEIASSIVSKTKEKMTTPVGAMDWGKTKIEFAIKPGSEYGGDLYVLLNGQFQFESLERFPRCDIICMVKTTARPIDDDYPLDPGRDSLRSPFKEEVKLVVDSVKQILEMINDNNLFKKGLNIKIYNKNAKPLSTNEEEDERTQQLRQEMQNAYQFKTDAFSEDKPPEEKDLEKKKLAQDLKNAVKTKGGDNLQAAMVTAAVEAMDTNNTKDTREEVDRIIETVSSPTAIIIQRNFTSQEIIDENPDLMKNMALMWHSVIRRTLRQASKLFGNRKKTVIPGLIYSDECIAVYIPPEAPGSPHIIGLNPLAVTSLVQPELMSTPSENIHMKEVELHEKVAERPDILMVDKLAALLHHEAIHEVTHFLFPDSWGSDRFHMYVSKMEGLCHFLYKDTRNDVRKLLSPFKNENKKLMKLIHRFRTPKDLAGGRKSSQVMSDADQKAIYEAFTKGNNYRELEKMFNLAPSNGMNAYRIVQKYKKKMGLASSAKEWIMAQSQAKTRHWITSICRLK